MSQQEYPKDYYRMPPLTPIPRPYRYKEVAAGEHETIFEWDVPTGHIGFIRQIANALAENGYWQLMFDNMPYRDDDKVEYVLGHIKPTDAVIVGMYPRFHDQMIRENADLVRKYG